MITKKTISTILGIALLILTVVDRFITPVSNWIGIPVLLTSVVWLIIGGLKNIE